LHASDLPPGLPDRSVEVRIQPIERPGSPPTAGPDTFVGLLISDGADGRRVAVLRDGPEGSGGQGAFVFSIGPGGPGGPHLSDLPFGFPEPESLGERVHIEVYFPGGWAKHWIGEEGPSRDASPPGGLPPASVVIPPRADARAMEPATPTAALRRATPLAPGGTAGAVLEADARPVAGQPSSRPDEGAESMEPLAPDPSVASPPAASPAPAVPAAAAPAPGEGPITEFLPPAVAAALDAAVDRLFGQFEDLGLGDAAGPFSTVVASESLAVLAAALGLELARRWVRNSAAVDEERPAHALLPEVGLGVFE
jgi:hypothetical protein